jgi:nucleoid-associated protein YgaU
MAGRAAPGALVTVKSDDQELGRVTADPRGEWALVPDLPLKSGTRQITLNARIGTGAPLEGSGAVVVVVPACDPSQPQSGDQTIAVLTPRQGASQLLQVPQAPSGARGLSLNTVDYDEKGNLTMTGRALPDTTVQVYVNNQPVGAPTADAQGKWTMQVDEKVPPGLYTLRVDQVEDTGKVISRLELPFARASAADIELRGNAVVVQPGNSLWRIARAAYGTGIQYTDIYTANREQIRDPDLIYPGQIFTLPEGQSRPN